MKKLVTVLLKTPVVSKGRNLCMVFAMILLCISCDELTSKSTSKENPEEITEVEASSPTDNIHVAFAGGGWRAHTAHTGWTFALLNNNGNKLDNVFKNVNTISSNSGGSWFSTMLMYSPQFVTDIETPGAINTWGSITGNGGWLGVQQNRFNRATFGLDLASCLDLSGDAYVACVFKYYGALTEWDKLVQKVVYYNYSLQQQTLSSPRQKWATDKSLLLAATMLTNNVVLSENRKHDWDYKHYEYYQACLSTSGPVVLNGNDGGSCTGGITPDAIPVTFSSMPNSPNLNMTAPPFLPATGTGSKKLAFNIGYSRTVSGVNPLYKSIQNPLINDSVQVIKAAAASSAALGFAASKNVSKSWLESYISEDLALNFSLVNSKVQFTGTEGKDLEELANGIVVRIADGGAADNSGVAQLVTFLQQNDQDSGFNIVAFDNVQAPPFHTGAGQEFAETGNDIATLFGYGRCEGNKFCSGSNCSGTCAIVPDLHVFDPKTIETPVTWRYPPKKNNPSKYMNTPKLIYTKYTVTTVANPSFGITEGSTGTLHAFTCYYPDASTVPENNTKNGSFIAYGEMIQFINDGLKANGNEGLIHLETAMGLK